jgi:hypothetical protein
MLSENLALQKTKVDKLSNIKNLNLWGAELSDVSLVAQMPNLEVLALSVNHVTTLRDIAECKNLRELYLRRNNITGLGEVYYLTKLPNLTTLWLSDNPCAKDPNYRMFTVRCCPALRQLDSVEVSPQERQDAAMLPNTTINEIVATRLPTNSAVPPAPPPSSKETLQARSEGPVARGAAAGSSASATPPTAALAALGAGPGGGRAGNTQTQKAILAAIMTLMGELAPESLELLHRDISERMMRK